MKKFNERSIIRYVSQLLKSIWLFFPGLLFLLFPIFCFWSMGQGKDIMTAFMNNDYGTKTGFHFNSARMFFFIAIAFWVYVSWYSSRIISYIKKTRQQRDIEAIADVDRNVSEARYKSNDNYFEIGKSFLEKVPRMIGNCCFLILELAVFQLPIVSAGINKVAAYIILIVMLIALHYLNKWIEKTQVGKQAFSVHFWILLFSFLTLLIVSCFFKTIPVWAFFFLLLFMHVIYIYYINLRRPVMEAVAKSQVITTGNERSLLEKLLDYFCVPRKESGYYKWFLIICSAGIVLYLLCIFWLKFARMMGPFPLLILAFAVLLLFGNFVTAFSVRYKINFHFLLLVLGLLLGLKETHQLRTFELAGSENGYKERPALKTYLTAWLNERLDSTDTKYDMNFIMANGGASRSGYWTAQVLGTIEDASLSRNLPQRFSDHIFCLSGTSGGAVGVATFFSLLRNKKDSMRAQYSASARHFLKQDYFTYTVARMLGPDFFNYIFHLPLLEDRAGALESSFEQSALQRPDSCYRVPFNESFSSFPAMSGGKIFMPLLFVNTTRMQDGSPALVSNLQVDQTFNGRIDVVKLLDSRHDITMTSAAILGARFPYLSPAGRLKDNYFVDGGYFDNSGAGTVQELIRGIINLGKTDSILGKKIKRINFNVIHIVNSPTGFVTAVEKVAPIKNDLMSPILTIVGAYDMQTTVNDRRLVNYLRDVNSNNTNAATYTQLSLYMTPQEVNEQKPPMLKREKAYAMNWFMSDTTRKRIDQRLVICPELKKFIGQMK
ncbi:MAG: patatin-like phospholipase family protein [Ferruginibacter sp.]